MEIATTHSFERGPCGEFCRHNSRKLSKVGSHRYVNLRVPLHRRRSTSRWGSFLLCIGEYRRCNNLRTRTWRCGFLGRRGLRKYRAGIPMGMSGPSSYVQWLAFWRVFPSASIMLAILPLVTLQLYERHIEKLKKLYPTAWHLVALADETARGEGSRLRFKFASDVVAGKAGPEFWDDAKHWVACTQHAGGRQRLGTTRSGGSPALGLQTGLGELQGTQMSTTAHENMLGGLESIEPRGRGREPDLPRGGRRSRGGWRRL